MDKGQRPVSIGRIMSEPLDQHRATAVFCSFVQRPDAGSCVLGIAIVAKRQRRPNSDRLLGVVRRTPFISSGQLISNYSALAVHKIC